MKREGYMNVLSVEMPSPDGLVESVVSMSDDMRLHQQAILIA
jgi:hypothetical protein